MAVGDGGETHAEFSRDFDGLAHRQVARGKGQALPCIDQQGGALAPHDRRHRTAVGAAVQKCVAYWATRDSPWEAMPWASASTNAARRAGGHRLVRAGATQRARRERYCRVESHRAITPIRTAASARIRGGPAPRRR